MCYVKTLRLGIIQTTIDMEAAWNKDSMCAPCMDWVEGEKAWGEICDRYRSISTMPQRERPHVILLPELTLPLSREYELRRYAQKLGAVLIAGLDFRPTDDYKVTNEALICIPSNWPFGKGQSRNKIFKIGKLFPSYREKEYINSCKRPDSGLTYEFKPCEDVYILNLGKYGNVGLSICADFYDLHRYIIYRGRIQHLFLLAYNRDLESFRHIAESISRIVYCNVAICNTGFYGGSLVFYPAYESHRRYIYRHEGAKLGSLQIVSIPVESIATAQSAQVSDAKKLGLKGVPPGYKYLWKQSDNK